MGYLYLSIAIVAEVIVTASIKAPEDFTKTVPSLKVVIGYDVALYCLSQVLKHMPVGVAYAIWSRIGVALISIVGIVIFGQKLDLATVIGILLIISGVVVLNVFSQSTLH